jgi:hypothetical protein
MDHARVIRYRRLALQEPDQDIANLLRLIADESERGVLVTSDWCALPRRLERPTMSQPDQPELSRQRSRPSEATRQPEPARNGMPTDVASFWWPGWQSPK